MPSYDAVKVMLQINNMDPSIFDEVGNRIDFSCDGFAVTIRTYGDGLIGVERQKDGDYRVADPTPIRERRDMLLSLFNPELYTVLSALLEKYEAYKSHHQPEPYRPVRNPVPPSTNFTA